MNARRVRAHDPQNHIPTMIARAGRDLNNGDVRNGVPGRESIWRAVRPSASEDYRKNFRIAAGFLMGGLLLIGLGIPLLGPVRVPQLGGVALGIGVLGSAAYFGLRGVALGVHYGLFSLRAGANIVAGVVGLAIGCLTLAAVALHLHDSANGVATFFLDQLPNLGIVYVVIDVVAVFLDSDRVLD